MTAPCPISKSKRHRWIRPASGPSDERECKHCGAIASIDHMGRTVFVASSTAKVAS